MAKGKIKERYERFKRWQLSPNSYEFTSDDVQHCQNCGHDFTGNYCPYCSQKAGEGLIDWRSVRQSFMDIWGLGSRSMPRTIWHLLLRPGYLISDYISGKRQVSFPPVKMLFFVAVIVVLLVYYLMPLLFGSSFDIYGGNTSSYEGFDSWNKTHFAWTYFGMALLGILPTWVLFRYAPVHPRHTLPQGFFIQVFLCVVNLVISFILLLPLLLINYMVYFLVSWAILFCYYVITYKQLFGYGIWGTLWRVFFVFGFIVLSMDVVLFLLFDIDSSQIDPNQSLPGSNRYIRAGIFTAYSLLLLGVGWALSLISRKKSKKTPSE